MTETFEQYTARMLALAGDDEPLGVMTRTPARIAELLSGRPAPDLRWSPEAGRWSIAEIVSHLAVTQSAGGLRSTKPVRIMASDRECAQLLAYVSPPSQRLVQ